jgi:hypothetical protein
MEQVGGQWTAEELSELDEMRAQLSMKTLCKKIDQLRKAITRMTPDDHRLPYRIR